MLLGALKTKSNMITSLIVFLLVAMSLILGIAFVFSYYGYQYARTTTDKVRQFYVDEVDKTNEYNVNNIPIDNPEILKLVKNQKVGLATLSPITTEIKVDNGGANNSGYFGRTFTVKVQRTVKIPFLKQEYVVTSSSTAVNRGRLRPDQDVNYNIGDEFYENTNGNGRT